MRSRVLGIAVGLVVAVGFTLGHSDGLAEKKVGDARPPTVKEIRDFIIKGEERADSRMGYLLVTPMIQRDYDVRYYRLDLAVSEQTETVGGEVIMVSDSRIDGLTSVDIDLFDNMQVDSVKSAGQSLSFTHTGNVIHADLPDTVNQGEQFLTRVFYSGTPQQFGFGPFAFVQHSGHPIIWSLSEPDGAPAWWPCNDDPSDKADSADIYLTVTDNLVASSEGTLESTVDNGDGTKTFYWKESYPIATYLISLAISNYDIITDWYVTTSGDSMPVIHHVYPESYGAALEDFNVTVPMIAFFAGRFGEYPFLQEKYGHSEFPWGGAMEHQTNTSYGTWIISGDHWGDMIVAHELAHQWWGDMITCRTWENIWLNEGFASYCEALWAENIGGDSGYRSYMVDMDRYYGGGNYPGSVYDPDELFNSTVYDKGGWVLHMLRGVMGDDDFFTGFWDYGNDPDLVYDAATTSQFQTFMETASGMDLDWFFQEWVYGVNRPYYEYWWASEQSGNDYQVTVHIDQIQQNAGVFRMPVDLRFAMQSGDTLFTVVDSLESQEFTFTLPEDPQSFDLDPFDWIMKHKHEVPPAGTGDDNPGPALPHAFALHQNYPNPFNPSTVISFDIPVELDGADFSLIIYDIRGRMVRRLQTGSAGPGENRVAWNGRSDNGTRAVSGLYLYRLVVGGDVQTKRMVLLK